MKKIRNHVLKIPAYLLLALTFVFNSCNEDSIEEPSNNSRVNTTDDLAILNERVRIPKYDEALSINDVEIPQTNARQENIITNLSTFTLVLRAEVDPPEVDSQVLQASHVFIEGNLAFVSYNTKGPEYKGGVEVFDISNIKAPSLVYQMIVEGTDYSSIYYEEGKIYLAGATESTDSFGLNSTALVEIVDYPIVPNQESTVIDIPSFTATDVKVKGDYIYVSSGSHGGLTVFNKNTLEEVSDIGMDDARSIAFNDEYYTVMQGTPARVKVYSTSDNSYINGYTVGGATIPESKSILSMTNDQLFIPAGREGLKILSLANGELLQEMPLPSIEGVAPELIVTNGVSVNDGRIFTANGAAGMFLSEQQENTVALLGSVNFLSSTNYVTSRENVMFVATGLGGLKIIEIMDCDPKSDDELDTVGDWDDNGTPQYLCEKDAPIASELKNKMSLIFRNRKNLKEREPAYFSPGAETDIYLTKDTNLEITFFGETAGYKNTMGYYVYDSQNPPQTPEELINQTVLFPNTSAKGSGGNLRRGNKVCLNDLKAGSVVGFFMVVDGWKGEITTGINTNYTTQSLNLELPNQYRQTSVLLGIEENDALVLGFEDIRSPGGDKDFDDAVFIIQTTTTKSIDYSNIIPLQ